MKITVDKESDTLYFRLDETKIVESEEVRPGVILDFDENDSVVGEVPGDVVQQGKQGLKGQQRRIEYSSKKKLSTITEMNELRNIHPGEVLMDEFISEFRRPGYLK